MTRATLRRFANQTADTRRMWEVQASRPAFFTLEGDDVKGRPVIFRIAGKGVASNIIDGGGPNCEERVNDMNDAGGDTSGKEEASNMSDLDGEYSSVGGNIRRRGMYE